MSQDYAKADPMERKEDATRHSVTNTMPSIASDGHSSTLFNHDESKSSDAKSDSVDEDDSSTSSPAASSSAESSNNPRAVSDDCESKQIVPPLAHARILEERSARWAALLTSRPASTDSGAMSAWLMEVLSVSDLDTPMQAAPSLEQDDPKSPRCSHGALITKKRHHSMDAYNVDEAGPDASSFAKWKDRKKHKGVPSKPFVLEQD